MKYTVFSPNKKLQYQNKNGQSQQLLSPDQKHDQKVQGLLQMIDSQFESMHQYQSSIENQPNFKTEPTEFQINNIPTKTVRYFKSQDNISKTALSNLLNLVDTNILKSTKLNHSKSDAIHDDLVAKYKNHTKTDQSVDCQNESQQDRMKTQMSNTSIQDASVQTKSSKRKKLGFFTYEISYLSPNKCKNCGLNDTSIQNQRAQSNYVNAFKEFTKNESILKCLFSKQKNKNQESHEDIKVQDQLFSLKNINQQKQQQPIRPIDQSSSQMFKRNKTEKNISQIAQDIKIISPPKQELFLNSNIQKQKKVLAQPYRWISQQMLKKNNNKF